MEPLILINLLLLDVLAGLLAGFIIAAALTR